MLPQHYRKWKVWPERKISESIKILVNGKRRTDGWQIGQTCIYTSSFSALISSFGIKRNKILTPGNEN